MPNFKYIFWRVISWSGVNTAYLSLRRNGQILCLGYHSVSHPSTDSMVRAGAYRHLSTPKNLFADEIVYLKTHGYTFLTLGDLVHIKRYEQPIPPRAVMIYFDDGYRDIYLSAYPILKEHRVPAGMFLATDCIDSVSTLWDDVPPGEPRIFLSWDEVRAMRDVFMYGSHSKTHPNFKKLTEEKMGHELAASKVRIETETEQAVHAFSFPYGRSTPESRVVLKRMGFDLAFTTQYGFNDMTSDWYDLKKISMKPDDTMSIFKLKLGIYYPLMRLLGRR